jgi:hypothetical protein
MRRLFSWLRRHPWATIGSVPALLEAGRWGESLLRWGEHSEFVLHRADDIKMLWNMLIAAPPQWVNVPLILAGFALIWWDLSRARHKRASAEGPALDGYAERIPSENGERAPTENLESRLAKLERLHRLSTAQIPPAEFQQLGESVAKLLEANEALVGEQGRQNRHLSLVSRESNRLLTILQSSLSIAVLHSLPDKPDLPEIAEIKPDTMGESQQLADKYFRRIMKTIDGTRWAPELDESMLQQNAAMAADMRLREASGVPAGVSVIDLRHYLIAKIKADVLSRHLSAKKEEYTLTELRGLLTHVVKTIAERDEFDRTGEFRP